MKVLEYAVKTLTSKNKGININRKYLNHLYFADDIVLITDNWGNVQVLIELE